MKDRIDQMVDVMKDLQKVDTNPQTQVAINEGIYYVLWLIIEELRVRQEEKEKEQCKFQYLGDDTDPNTLLKDRAATIWKILHTSLRALG